MVKDQEDREGDIRQLFGSILSRINERLPKEQEITILDKLINEAVEDYCKTYKDEIMYKG